MLDFMNVTRALSDENRVRILMALSNQTFCVCQMTALLDLSPSTTSKHLSILKQARLIEAKKVGKWVYYSLPRPETRSSLIQQALDWVDSSLRDKPIIIEDARRISEILLKEVCVLGFGSSSVHDEFHSLAVHSVAEMEDEAILEQDSV